MLGTSSCVESTLVNHQRSDAFYANQKYLIPKSVMSLEGAANTTSQSYINGTSHNHENQSSDPNLHSITKPIKHETKPFSQGRPEDLIQELAKLAKSSGGDRPLGDDQNTYPDHHQHEPAPAPVQTQLPPVSPPAQPAFPSEEPVPKGGDLAEVDAEKEVSNLLNVALANKAGRGTSLQASPFKDSSAPFPIGNGTGNFQAMGGFTPQQQHQSQSLSPQEKLESSHSMPDRSPVRANPETTSAPNPHLLDNQDKNCMFPPPGVIHVTPTSPGLPETTNNAPTISSSQPLPSYSNMAPHQGAKTAQSGTTTPTETSSLSPQDNMGGITSTPKVLQQDPDGSPPEGASRSSFEDMNMSQDLDKSNHTSDYGDDYGMKGMDSAMESWGGMPIMCEGEGGNERFYCHLCSYVGTSQYLFRAHMNSHFEHNCPHCDYTSRTEGRLKKHIKDFHSDSQNATDNANRTMRTQPGRPKVFRCKQCEFVSTTKEDFWIHSRIHIKAEKILQCPKCPFVTEYKHHLEYHLRNHFGSKPFKCNKCNYSCVNKSMLNSHMKSHTNVYQYRCADCTYATKYCHSLKLHLQKYNHKPATVLNPDGSLPVDGSGDFELVSKRGPPRGPRGPRKDSPPHESMKPMMPHLGMNPAHAMNGGLLPSPFWPLMGQLSNGFQGPPPLIPVSAMAPLSVNLPAQNKFMGSTSAATPVGRGMKCNWCDMVTDSPEKMNLHVLKVHGAENQDLLNMFGLHGDLMEETAMKHARLANASEDVKSLLLSPKKEMSLAAAQNLAARRSTWHGDLAAMQQHQAMMMGMNKEQATSNFRSPPAHSPASEAAAKQQMVRSEGNTAQGMPRKSNKEKSDYPLDLSRSYPMYMDSEEDAYDQSYDNQMDSSQQERESHSDITRPMEASPKRSLEESAEVRPRKRSRKGKAYKLDRLCMRLQDNASMSPSREDSCDEYVMSDYMGGAATQDDAEGHSATSENSSEQALVPHASGDSPQEELQPNLKELHSNNHALNGVSQEEGEDCLPGGAATDKRNMSSSFSAMPGEGHEGINPSGPRMDCRDPMSGSNGNMTGDNNSSAYINHLPKSDVRQLGMGKNKFECTYCEIIFKDCIMYTMHMGYHGYKDPFKCNMCGHQSGNKVEFFLHIARAAHE